MNNPYEAIPNDEFLELRGAHREQQRIIDLLETRLNDCYEKNDMGGWSFEPDLFIALIKGEIL